MTTSSTASVHPDFYHSLSKSYIRAQWLVFSLTLQLGFSRREQLCRSRQAGASSPTGQGSSLRTEVAVPQHPMRHSKAVWGTARDVHSEGRLKVKLRLPVNNTMAGAKLGTAHLEQS